MPTHTLKSLLSLLCLLGLPSSLPAQAPRVAQADSIMIVAHPLAAHAGLRVFEQGGNVVDAAVATAYALGVVEPHGSGIGGEGMMLIYQAREKAFTVIDFKAISPAAASYRTLDFSNIRSWARSARGASVPGAVAGLELAREKFGRLGRDVVLQPAIDYAERGFTVDSILAGNLAGSRKTLGADSASAAIYYPEGNAPAAASTLRNPDYARSLRLIQRDGAAAFYTGPIARQIVADMKARGGLITFEDLAAYRPVVREALHGEYRGYEIVTTPPPCGGMLLLETLNILKRYDLSRHDAYAWHLLAETFKLVYKDEATFNGDPAFDRIPAEWVASDAFAAARATMIDTAHARAPGQVPPGPAEEKHTTHLSVMDHEGNAVALTITLSSLFGTAHTVAGAGFLLNNEMQNFNPDSTQMNRLLPHKRVVTSLVPTIILKGGRPVAVTGAPGGDLIISSVAQVILNLLERRMPMPEAVAAPRIYASHAQPETELENLVPPEILTGLRSKGHTLTLHDTRKAYFAVVHSIQYDTVSRKLVGVADLRRSGAAVGR